MFVFLFGLSDAYAATSSSCKELKAELVAMKDAQQQIMGSLVNNHETFATSLEEFSQVVGDAKKGSEGKISKEMDESAQAFRSRGVQGKKMATQLDKATNDLIKRVAACL
ncbi:hypothetical protein D3C72_1804970 [compost metagenome]